MPTRFGLTIFSKSTGRAALPGEPVAAAGPGRRMRRIERDQAGRGDRGQVQRLSSSSGWVMSVAVNPTEDRRARRLSAIRDDRRGGEV